MCNNFFSISSQSKHDVGTQKNRLIEQAKHNICVLTNNHNFTHKYFANLDKGIFFNFMWDHISSAAIRERNVRLR